MVSWKVSTVLVFLLISCAISPATLYTSPDVRLEALSSGGFRAFMKDIPGTSQFAIHANVNDEIAAQGQGDFYKEQKTLQNGYWVVEFPKQLKVGDIVNYWVFVTNNYLEFRIDKLQWQVVELLDSYSPFRVRRVKASTIVNGGTLTNVGQAIINEEFNDGLINNFQWVSEHFIPTYAGPNYEFNSYEDRNETRFIRNGILYLKPVALQSEEDVRGHLDLRDRCTSHVHTKCSYMHRSSFILPPVKSARLTSKTSFRYGKIEIRAKLPAGDWIYPILQLEPRNDEHEDLPTVWIAYSRGNDHLKGNAGEDIGSRVLFGGSVLHPQEPVRSKELVSQSSAIRPYNSDFHVYTLNWVPGKMTFLIDSEEYGTVSLGKRFADPSLGIGSSWTNPEAPFDTEYVLSLGVGVGGTKSFPDGYTTGNSVQKPWKNGDKDQVKKFFEARQDWLSTWNNDDPALQIDYVKVTAV